MNITVFLVDDHATIREGLRFLLDAQENIEVVGVACNGREAVKRVPEICPNVVVMDIAMPELNGIEATQKITKQCPSTNIIILSMLYSNEQIYRALQAGARGYLVKETAGIEIATAVRTVYTGKRYLSDQISDKVIDSYIEYSDQDQFNTPLTQLATREREVLQLVVEGQTSCEIAVKLSLSCRTVETYRRRIMQKLDIRNLAELVRFAIGHGLTPM